MQNRELEAIIYEGVIEDVIFQNDDTGFLIANLETADDFICIKGIMPFINGGERVRVSGAIEIHPIYGEQLNVKYLEHIKPKEKDELLKYLSSGIIRGIGEATAHLLIDAFGENVLEIFQNNPSELLKIPGIGPKKLEQIIMSYKEQYELRDFIMYFQNLNISNHMAMKIFRQFGIEAIEKIEANPYILADEISGIGFKFADQLAMNMGIGTKSPFRISSGITFLLSRESSSGNVYLYKEQLLQKVERELGIEEELVDKMITEMAVKGDLYLENGDEGSIRVYLPALYYAEQQVAIRLIKLLMGNASYPEDVFEEFLIDYQEERGILLGESQKTAIKNALNNGVFIITGGPGTGKTTIINAVIKALEIKEKKVLLAAPTGRAAKRMTEATQREARTIHRLLEFQGEMEFQRNELNPLEGDVIIIDEISMVDVILMNRLLQATPENAQLILVGDSDQLPSVGPGAVLKDLLGSGIIPTVRLDEIYRQSETSLIALNAHKINRGDEPILNKKDKDFFFISHSRAEQILEEIKRLVKDRLPSYYGINPIEDVQVLAPMKGTGVGVDALNTMLQNVLNPNDGKKCEKKFGHRLFREGDKVMQIKNNYSLDWRNSYGEEGKGVFNGDIGFITEIDETLRTITVVFDGEKEVVYDYPMSDELTLAYAVTVHKSQGSEFKVVIMPISYGPPMLMSRNILYTAITRARELVVLVGDKRYMHQMIGQNHEEKRLSGLNMKLNHFKNVWEELNA